MTIEELLAREAIRDTIHAYTLNGDRGAIGDYAANFLADGVLETDLGTATGPEEIERFIRDVAIPDMAGMLAAGRLRHHLTTSRVLFADADTADAWTYFQLIQGGAILEHGLYADRLRRQGERWLFARRSIRIEWQKRG